MKNKTVGFIVMTVGFVGGILYEDLTWKFAFWSGWIVFTNNIKD